MDFKFCRRIAQLLSLENKFQILNSKNLPNPAYQQACPLCQEGLLKLLFCSSLLSQRRVREDFGR